MSKFSMSDAEAKNAAYPTFETNKGDKPIAYVLVGLPGSGKSGWAANHPQKLPIASTDAYVENYAKKKKLNYAQAFKACYPDACKDLKKQIEKFTKKPKSFIWDQVNLVPKERIEMHARLDPTHRVVYVCFRVPLSECLRRHEARDREAENVVDAKRIQDLAKVTRFPQTGKEPYFKCIMLTHPDWGKAP